MVRVVLLSFRSLVGIDDVLDTFALVLVVGSESLVASLVVVRVNSLIEVEVTSSIEGEMD